jgi:tol-pal system protein YbgF
MNPFKNGGKGAERFPILSLSRLCFLPIIGVCLSSSGCMLATQQDMMKLDDNLTRMSKTQADLVSKMTDLSGNLEGLNSQLESSQQRMTQLSQRLDDLQADLARRFNVLTGQVTGTSNQGQAGTTPSDLYRLASNDYQAGKFDLALSGFRNFVNQYPKSELAPQAQFYSGEAEFARKNWVDAAREYDKVVQNYSKSEFEPKALFKRSMALQQIGHTQDAVQGFKRLIQEHPNHDLAKSARQILKDLQ